METAELALQFLKEMNCRIVRQEDDFIQFRYQMSDIAFLCSYGADNFFCLVMLGLEQIADGRYYEVLDKCNALNISSKQTKFYVKGNMVYASVETCYRSEDDFAFQFRNALASLVKDSTNYYNCNII